MLQTSYEPLILCRLEAKNGGTAIFWFLIDMTEVNMYIMYLSRTTEGRNPIPKPMTHLQFKIALAKALAIGNTV
jgi:hypothetical protein